MTTPQFVTVLEQLRYTLTDKRTPMPTKLVLVNLQIDNALAMLLLERKYMSADTTGDPAVARWIEEGCPVAGCDWSGDYSGIDGSGEIRLTLAAS